MSKTTKPKLVALDSNVFIAFLAGSEQPEFFTAAADILQAVERGEIEATFSTLVYGEVMRLPSSTSTTPIEEFFASLDAANIAADEAICRHAAVLRNKNAGLKLPDAIHLATAIAADAEVFITADKQLLKIAQRVMNAEYLPDVKI